MVAQVSEQVELVPSRAMVAQANVQVEVDPWLAVEPKATDAESVACKSTGQA